MSCIDFKAELPGTLGTYQVTWYYMNLGTRSVTYTFRLAPLYRKVRSCAVGPHDSRTFYTVRP